MALALCLLVWGACWLFVPGGEDVGFDRYQLPKELWLPAVAAVALVLASLRRVAADPLSVCLAALLGCVALATALATSVPLALRGAALVASAAAAFVAARTCDDREASAVERGVVLAVAAVASLALLEAFGLITGVSATGRSPGSTLGQRNAVAHLALLTSPTVWTLAASAPSRRSRAVLLATAALLAAAIVVTRCRAAWLVAPLVVLAWLWVHKKATPVAVAVASAALVALLPVRLAWNADHPYLDTAARLLDARSGSGLGRLTQYRATLGLALQHPLFGVGPSNWAVEYPVVSPPSDPTFHADAWLPTGRLLNSDWLALAAEGGLAALLAACALALGLLRRRSAAPTLLALAALGAFDAVLQLAAPAACAAVLLGLQVRGAPARAAPRLAPLLGAVVLAGAAVLGFTRLVALLYRLQGGFESVERAVQWNGADLIARTTLAESYLLEDQSCTRARPHLEALVRLLPRHPMVRSQAQVCAVSSPAQNR